MINRHVLVALGLILLLIIALPAMAQDRRVESLRQDEDSTLDVPKIIKDPVVLRARRMIQFGDYARAAELIQSLLENAPDNIMIKNLLARCYEEAKDYRQLVLFLGRRVDTEPPDYMLYRNTGRAHLLAGQTDSARVYLYRAAELALGRENSLGAIAGILHQYGQYETESEFIDSVRTLTGNPAILAGRMGDALAAQQQFGAATLEYLNYMERDSIAAEEGEARLIALIRYERSVDTVMSILNERIGQKTGSKKLLNIYGQLLMEQNRYDDAFEFFRSRDSINNRNGADIVYFMQECLARGQHAQAIKAGEYVTDSLPRSPLAQMGRYHLGEAYTAAGQYTRALETYDLILRDNIRQSYWIEANLKSGQIYKDHLHDTAQAQIFLGQVTRMAPGSRYDIEARFGLAEILIGECRYDSALSVYTWLIEHDLPEEFAEEAEFSRARLHVFAEQFTEAAAAFKAIITHFPKGFYVNDAIQYSLLINETLDRSPKQMDLFAAAEYYRYVRRNDSLEYYLTKICRVGIPSLAPSSYLQLARMYRDQTRMEAAVAAIDSLAALYQDSYSFPYGMKLKADIFMETPKTRETALEIYRNLLEEFATYPFAAEVRDILRREASGEQI